MLCGPIILKNPICYMLKLIEEWEINNDRRKCVYAGLLDFIFPQLLENEYYELTGSLREMALKLDKDNNLQNYVKMLKEQKFKMCNRKLLKKTVLLIQKLIINGCIIKVSLKNCFCRQALEIVRNVRMRNFNDIPLKGQMKITDYFASV